MKKFNPHTNLEHAVVYNRQREKYKRLIGAVHKKTFDYADSGKTDKAQRVLKKLRTAVNARRK